MILGSEKFISSSVSNSADVIIDTCSPIGREGFTLTLRGTSCAIEELSSSVLTISSVFDLLPVIGKASFIDVAPIVLLSVKIDSRKNQPPVINKPIITAAAASRLRVRVE